VPEEDFLQTRGQFLGLLQQLMWGKGHGKRRKGGRSRARQISFAGKRRQRGLKTLNPPHWEQRGCAVLGGRGKQRDPEKTNYKISEDISGGEWRK